MLETSITTQIKREIKYVTIMIITELTICDTYMLKWLFDNYINTKVFYSSFCISDVVLN